jgi:hypothetical protein
MKGFSSADVQSPNWNQISAQEIPRAVFGFTRIECKKVRLKAA